MLSAEEISELKREHDSLDKGMEKIGKDQRPTVVRLSERLKGLMAEIESTQEREKELWNPALVTRIKIAKKGNELLKEVNYFEMEVVGEFQKGNVSQDAGKRFILIARRVQAGDMKHAKKEFAYFEEIIELSRRYGKCEEELEKDERTLRREQLKIEKILGEMSELVKETVDLEKVRRYEELSEVLDKLQKARETHLHSLLCTPVAKLLGDMEEHPLKGHYPSFPGKEEMAELKGFFSDYPVFGKCNADELCEFFGYSEKKLSHVCPETSRFRRVVAGNRGLFEMIRSLEQTDFLSVDDEDEKVMDFYAEKVDGAGKTVERIRLLKKDKDACREEYEKSRRIEKKKEEMAGYSRTELEKELKEIKHLLGLLHSEHPEGSSEGKGGLLSMIGSFLKGY